MAGTAGRGTRRKETNGRPRDVMSDAEESAAQRDRLIADVARLQSSDEAADWVHKNLPVKNTLIAVDAESVEASFRERLAAIEAQPQRARTAHVTTAKGGAAPTDRPPGSDGEPFAASPEDPAVGSTILPGRPAARRRRVAAKTIRLRDKEHCNFVATQPCVVCGRTPTEAHHIRFAQPRALGRKVSDEYTVPVCRLHHRDLHSYGDEASWWAGVGIDPLPIALELWRRSRLTYSLDATWSDPLSDAIPPPAAKVERTPLDNDARDRSDVAEHPESPLDDSSGRCCTNRLVESTRLRLAGLPAMREIQASEAKSYSGTPASWRGRD